MLQLHWRFPWAPDDGQIHRVMRSAAIAPHFEIAMPALSASPSNGDGCAGRLSLSCEYSMPRWRHIGDPARFANALLGGLDGCAEQSFFRD
jgi:hypothetical protein